MRTPSSTSTASTPCEGSPVQRSEEEPELAISSASALNPEPDYAGGRARPDTAWTAIDCFAVCWCPSHADTGAIAGPGVGILPTGGEYWRSGDESARDAKARKS